MKCYSLFSGIGGFDLALERQGHEIVGACEKDQYAREVFTRHFPRIPLDLDATRLEPEGLPGFELLCAGFPCPTFSMAGRRLGLKDKRGRLFFEIVRIARQKRPRYLLLENVKGLLSDDNGRTFAIFLTALDELGYDAEWQVLNSKNYVPQNRERIFIIGHLRGESWREVFPLRESDKVDVRSPEEAQGKRTRIRGSYSRAIQTTPHKGTASYVKTIDANFWKGAQGRTAIKMVPSERYRQLTPLECERLQGFPDGWTKGISDTQRYKCLGNAVTVPVVEDIIRAMDACPACGGQNGDHDDDCDLEE